MLIAAAGNVNADKSVGRNNAQDVRDLEKHPFFPACLSKDFENVLTVTTVSEANGDVSPSQNYANRIVDIGVDCDQIVSGDYRFADSLGRNTLLIGSSYATPIVAGKIAQHYNALTSGMAGGINKSILLSRMQQMGLLTPNLLLSQYVRDGNCTKK